tara:strand:+ start:2231 stop:2581 length:351 start_codon:yes stop_codon:yes gene_type:complete
MATFPSITPSYGTQKRSMPNLVVNKFQDGFEQRQIIGLAANQNGKVYSLKFNNISETDADTIETFLDARAIDQASFTFTPPGESASSKYVCDNWNKTMNYLNRATISATFREVFEP